MIKLTRKQVFSQFLRHSILPLVSVHENLMQTYKRLHYNFMIRYN